MILNSDIPEKALTVILDFKPAPKLQIGDWHDNRIHRI